VEQHDERPFTYVFVMQHPSPHTAPSFFDRAMSIRPGPGRRMGKSPEEPMDTATILTALLLLGALGITVARLVPTAMERPRPTPVVQEVTPVTRSLPERPWPTG
jgi:hypothetical protein